MASSMTGFASSQALADPFRLVWELRSVNHRFLDIKVSLPAELRSLEPACRERIRAALARGKIDGTLTVTREQDRRPGTGLREDAVLRLLAWQRRVRELAPEADPLSVGEVLRWPGAVEPARLDPAALESDIAAALGSALDALVAARRREGRRLTAAIRERCLSVRNVIAAIRPRLGETERRYRRKLQQRLERFAVDADPQRLEQELAQLAQRLDIAEELDRLGGHVDEMEAILARDEPMGRRLDFLLQELNREANTLAAKSQDAELTRAAVELKVLVEQMREQVQNLE